MIYNKLLQKQIEKSLSNTTLELPEVKNLLGMINDSYISFERDKQLLERTFQISEEEFISLNNELTEEINKRKESEIILKSAITHIADSNLKVESGDILDFSKLLNVEVGKRKLAENVLTSLINNLPFGVVLVDSNDHILYINSRFYQLFNIDASGIGSQTDELQEVFEKCISQNNHSSKAIKQKDAIHEFVFETMEGVFIEQIYIPIPKSDYYGGNLWIFTDVTNKITTERELASQKKFTEDVLNGIPTDIAVFDNKGKYIFVNPHGINNEEIRKWIIGKNNYDYFLLKGMNDDIAKKREEVFLQTIQQRDGKEWVDEHINKQGEKQYILRKYHPIYENETLKFVIGYGVNITYSKLNEIKLENSLNDIQKINNELEQFAYVASHDLQEPLRTITNFLSLLERKFATMIDPQAKSYIDYSVDAAKRMRHLILDLLEFSRVGRITDGKAEDIDLNELINEIILLHRQQMEDLSATINFDQLPILHSYKAPIRQIFQNFINNGIKYHRENVSPIVSIVCKDAGDFWQFSITDNGIGINKQYFEKIFVIFQRLNNRQQYAGTGIGLTISKKIIEGMNGKIWLDSEEGIGTTFHFTIPKKLNYSV